METIAVSTKAPLDVVRARLQEGCRRRGWRIDVSSSDVSIAMTTKRMGTLARFTGHLTSEGATTRLTGDTRAPVVYLSSALALALGAMPLVLLYQLASGLRGGKELEILEVIAMGLVALIPAALAVLFGWLAYASPARLRQVLRAGIEEMITNA